MSKIYTLMSNVLTAESPNNSLSAGAWLWSSSILFEFKIHICMIHQLWPSKTLVHQMASMYNISSAPLISELKLWAKNSFLRCKIDLFELIKSRIFYILTNILYFGTILCQFTLSTGPSVRRSRVILAEYQDSSMDTVSVWPPTTLQHQQHTAPEQSL